ncbi:MAG: choice-of-anchor L domain-containing protein [Putridiphycobacter sp.]
MKILKLKTIGILFLLFPFSGYNQLTINNSQTATQLAQILAGPNVTVSNATLTGSALASGSFDGTNSNIGMASGVILSSGNVNNAPGPNNTAGTGDDLGTSGTAQMDGLAGVNTQDAITLQFDFEVQSDFIQFQYIFASEEYPEYAPPNSSAFNDVFAFFISGPGIVGEENIALVPGTSNPVTINNINPVTNSQYYIDNAGGSTVQYDGWTTVLTAERQNLTPCNTYTMKLVIADAGDGIFNSAVFLLENSFIQGIVDINTQTVNADNIALEGCIPASFTISLDTPSATDTQVSYQIGGSATNGVDYHQIDTVVTIPAGQTSASIVINSISDGFAEGQEDIYLIFQPTLCAPADTAFLFINDAQPIQFDLQGSDLTCFDNSTGSIQVNATGGFPPYTYHLTTNGGNGVTTQTMNNPITGLDAGQYSVQVYDTYGCKAEALVIGGLYNAGQTFLPDGSGVSYTSDLTISGFDTGETIANISQVQQVCATMEHSYLGDLQIKIISPSGEEVILKEFNGGGSCDLGEPIATSPIDGQASSTLTDPGTGYEYCWTMTPNYGTMVSESNNYTRNYTDAQGHNYNDNYLPAGSYASFETLTNLVGATMNGDWTIEVTDQYNLDNGYIFEWNIALTSGLPDTLVTISEPNEIQINEFITQANCGGADGAINLSVVGDYPPFTYLWSNGETTANISNLSAGTYTVYVSDANGCTDSATYNLNNISSLNISSVVTDVTCSGGTDGAINITTSGGTMPYVFNWSSGQTTEDISALSEGTYTLNVTDANNCMLNEDIVVGTIPAINISSAGLSNEFCGQQNGEIILNVTGGTGSYAYAWDNGATTGNIYNLQAGTYNVTVTDANSCTSNNSFTVLNDVSNCSAYCYLTVTSNNIVDENCGDNSGLIDININNATQPYNVVWTTGQLTEDINGLSAGNYSVTVSDANQCSVTETFNVGNSTGNFAFGASQIINDNCGNGTGSIDVDIVGGVAPYVFSWDNGSTTEDISNLVAGNYMLTVTDNSGCVITNTFTVGNNTGTLDESAGILNETCGNSLGVIDLTISGGVAPYSYVWSNGASTEDLNFLSAGTYHVVITDAVGCELTSNNYTVSNSSGTLALNNLVVTNEDCGNSGGEIDITVGGGTMPYSFSWSNGSTSEDVTGLNAGVYFATVTDANGCQVNTGNQNVFNTGSDLNVTLNSLTDEVCGNSSGAIDVQITGGTSPYTFNWSNGAITEDVSGLTAGDYYLTLTDNNGCEFSYSETVQSNSGTLNASVNLITDEVCGDESGSIDVNVSGGSIPYAFVWSNGDNTEDISNLSAGVYNLSVADNNGCQTSISATVSGDGISITSSTINDEICGDASGIIDLMVSGGTTPYIFNWSNGSNSEDISGLTAGTYTVNITDATGCSVNQSFIVGNNSNGLGITNTSITDENCGDGLGSIDISTTGGMLPLSYTWSNGSTTEDLSGLSGGLYSVVIQDVNGCTVSQTNTVNNISGGFTASVSSIVDENCGDGSGTIDVSVSGGSAPYTFLWSNGSTSEDLTALSAGNYSVEITESNGCSITLNAIVGNNTGTLAISNVTVQNENCGNASGFIDLTLSGGNLPYTYLWDNGATTEDISGLSAGNYSCIISDNTGCVVNYSSAILNNGGGIGTQVTLVDELCGNGTGSIDVVVSGGINPYVYSWTGGTPQNCCDYTLVMSDAGNSWNGAFIDVLVDGASIGNYTVSGGGANTETFQICSGSNVELVWSPGNFDFEVGFDFIDPSGNVLYSHTQGTSPVTGTLYTFASTCPAPANNTTSLGGLSSGNYDLIITDAVGCELVENYTINNAPSPLIFNNIFVTNENCGQGNGQITADVIGGSGLTYFLDGNAQQFGPPGNFFGLSQGSYLVAALDDNGCSVDSLVAVENVATFTTTIISVVDENCGQGNGGIDFDVTGSSNNYSYSWDNGETTQDLTGLSAGTYTCTITDNVNLCDDMVSITINNLTDIAVQSVVSDEYCGDQAGAIDLTVTGSTNVSFAWSNGATTEDLTGLIAGTYTCLVTNNLTLCEVQISVDVLNVTTGFTVSSTVQDELCGNMGGAIDLTTSNGSGNYSYAWSNGETTEDISGLSAGNYSVTVTDVDNACNSTLNFNISDNVPFTVTSVLTESTCPICSDGAIDLTIVENGGGDAPYYFSWSNGDNTEDISNLTEGTYSVFVQGNSGCQYVIDFEIINNNSSVGFNDEEALNLSVYPNPANTIVYVRYNQSSTDNVVLTITSFEGKIVYNTQLPLDKGLIKIDTDSFADGIYFVNVKSNGISRTQKLIITK